eukprot:895164_1
MNESKLTKDITWVHDMHVGDKVDVMERFGWGKDRLCWFTYTLIEKDYVKNMLHLSADKVHFQGKTITIPMNSDDLAPLHTHTLYNHLELSTPFGYSYADWSEWETSHFYNDFDYYDAKQKQGSRPEGMSNAIHYYDTKQNKHYLIMLRGGYIYKYDTITDEYIKYHSVNTVSEHTPQDDVIACDNDNDILWIFHKMEPKLSLFNLITKRWKHFVFSASAPINIAKNVPSTSYWSTIMNSLQSWNVWAMDNAPNSNPSIAFHHNYWQAYTTTTDTVDVHSVPDRWGRCRTYFIPSPFHQFHIIQVQKDSGQSNIVINHIVYYIIQCKWEQYQFTIDSPKDSFFPKVSDIVYISKLRPF